MAGGFVTAVLLLAGLTALYWWQHDAALWLPATIAVLVVTCPCALSLATPAAITAATGHLTRLGLLVTRGHALETFAHATHFIFDKTGTLTRGRLRLLETRSFSRLTAAQCLTLAAALERHLITVLILLAAVTPITAKMTSDAGTNKSKKWLVLAGCIKYARSLDQLTGMKS